MSCATFPLPRLARPSLAILLLWTMAACAPGSATTDAGGGDDRDSVAGDAARDAAAPDTATGDQGSPRDGAADSAGRDLAGGADRAPGRDTASPDSAGRDRPPPAGAVHLIGFGDSVTDGFCANPESRSYFELLLHNADHTYPAWEGRDLASHFATVTSNNQAISGSASCDYQASDFTQALAADPYTDRLTVVVGTLGGNDLIHDYNCRRPADCHAFCATLEQATAWAEQYKQRLLSFVRALQQGLGSQQHIFLANIYDPTDGVGDIENSPIGLPAWPDGLEVLALYNQKIAEVVAETGVHLVDMHGAVLGHGIHYNDPGNPYYDAADPTYWFCSNLEDPNNAGYHAIREVFWNAIAEVLGLE